jgi:hypothetical protein
MKTVVSPRRTRSQKKSSSKKTKCCDDSLLCMSPTFETCFKTIREYLTAFKKEKYNSHSGAAVVFDIDGTIVSETHRDSQNSRAILLVKKIYDSVVSKGISVYFVSARYSDQDTLDFTRAELSRLGYKTYSDLFLMPLHYKSRTVENISLFKCATRVHIQNVLGKQIILNVGNTWHDLCLHAPYLPQGSSAYNSELLAYVLSLPDDYFVVVKGLPDSAWTSFKLPETIPMKQLKNLVV